MNEHGHFPIGEREHLLVDIFFFSQLRESEKRERDREKREERIERREKRKRKKREVPDIREKSISLLSLSL